MRGQSSGLVTAADKIPAIGVLFAVDYDVIVRKPCFQRGTTHVFLKNFRSFLFKFFGQRHGVLILLQPIRIGPCSGGRSIFRSIPGIFFCLFWRRALRARVGNPAYDQINSGRQEWAYHLTAGPTKRTKRMPSKHRIWMLIARDCLLYAHAKKASTKL